MNSTVSKLQKRALRKRRIRAVVTGTTVRPRLTVFISNRHITAQLIDDTKHSTIAYVTTAANKTMSAEGMSKKAVWVGSEIAKKGKKANITQVVFDRNGKLFHGRVKALADAAREAGLEF